MKVRRALESDGVHRFYILEWHDTTKSFLRFLGLNLFDLKHDKHHMT
jgi:hypothetical protein